MLYHEISRLLGTWGLPEADLTLWTTITACGLSVIAAWAIYAILTRIIIPTVLKLVHHTDYSWDDILLNPPLLRVVAELATVLLLKATLPDSLSHYATLSGIALVGCRVALVAAVVHLINRFIVALYELLENNASGRVTSLKGIRQMLQILVTCVGVIIVISILAQKDPLTIITGLGAAATVLMLVFKDSILGVVAGVQLTLNDMLRPGDWITVPARNINGTVLEVGLIAVKVQNFDNTIVTVPPYSLLSESFQNWRGMTDSGGRRINRSVTIDINSITFLPEETIATFKQEAWWSPELESGAPHVNLTLFRAYLGHYLATLPDRNTGEDMTCMVRELAPTAQGVPVDIYFFTKTTSWVPYEMIQARVMDHIYAAVGRFGLRIYQAPSGLDILTLAR